MIIETQIKMPPGHSSPDEFCRWVISTALKEKIPRRAINQLGTHKWWLMVDKSKGTNTPECFALFVNIGVDRPQLTHLNTALVCWNPVPFGWGIWERFKRTIKRTNYPSRGDVLQTIPLCEYMSCSLYQMQPVAYRAKDSRRLWDVMQNIGWVLVAQGETYTPNR